MRHPETRSSLLFLRIAAPPEVESPGTADGDKMP